MNISVKDCKKQFDYSAINKAEKLIVRELEKEPPEILLHQIEEEPLKMLQK